MFVPSLEREYGGPTAKALQLAHALRELGVEVELLGAGDRVAQGCTPLGRAATFHGTPIPRRLRPFWTAIRDADLVHVIGYRDPVAQIAFLIARRLRVPTIVEPVGTVRRQLRSLRLKQLFDRGFGTRLLTHSTIVIATSEDEIEQLQEAGAPPHKVVLRWNAVDVSSLLSRGREARRGESGGATLLTICRISAIKNLTLIANALPDDGSYHWLLAGPDEGDGALEDVRAILRRRGLEKHATIFPQGVWGDARRELFEHATAFCLPSTSESFGSAVVEAAAVGIPVITTSTTGASRLLPPASTLIVEPDDVAGLAAALISVKRSRTMFEAEAAAAASSIRAQFSWTQIGAEQLAIYESVLA